MLPAPAVQVFCYLPRIDHGELVDFMVDTGASGTCLNGTYAYNLQSRMNPATLYPSGGIGGSCQYYNEKALLIFRDETNSLFHESIDIGIQEFIRGTQITPELLKCPCLLGRDILTKCKFVYDERQNNTSLYFV